MQKVFGESSGNFESLNRCLVRHNLSVTFKIYNKSQFIPHFSSIIKPIQIVHIIFVGNNTIYMTKTKNEVKK